MKIGLIGGTFDPIHWGHLIIAEEAADIVGLHRVVFIPASIPPHKIGHEISNSNHRVNMVNLAIESNDRFVISDYELTKSGPSYTIDTVKNFRCLFPEDELYFIMGHDSFNEIETWFQYSDIFKLCRVVVITRPGTTPVDWSAFGEKMQRYYPQDVIEISTPTCIPESINCASWKICMINIPGLDVSATEIRSRVSTGRTIKYLVSDQVEKYIASSKLYLK